MASSHAGRLPERSIRLRIPTTRTKRGELVFSFAEIHPLRSNRHLHAISVTDNVKGHGIARILSEFDVQLRRIGDLIALHTIYRIDDIAHFQFMHLQHTGKAPDYRD